MPQLFGQPAHSAPSHVLIVEDDVETLELLAEFCRRQGLTVTEACDGRAALTHIHRARAQFDIVITDVNLPGADGFEVSSVARSANLSCYVVVISGFATLQSAVRAVRAGAYDYLTKPFSLGQLEVVLRRISDRMLLERENRALLRKRPDASPPSEPASPEPHDRLSAIEDRLARIESLLQRLIPDS